MIKWLKKLLCKETILVVKIIKCSNYLYWYNNKINRKFHVIDCKLNEKYKIVEDDELTSHYILKKDCEVIVK